MEQARILVTTFAFGFALLALLFSARAVKAGGVEPSWASWKLDVNAHNGSIQAIWYVTVGGYDKNDDPVSLHTEPFTLHCILVDDVDVDGNQIVFGGGYIACDIPDLLEEANKIIHRHYGDKFALQQGREQCDCAPIGLAYAKADLMVKSEDTSMIFYHPSLHFDLKVKNDDLHNNFYFAGLDSTSSAINDRQGLFESHYLWDEANRAYAFEHYVHGSQIDAERVHKPLPASLITAATTVFIGGTPAGQQQLLGALDSLKVDPGCRVH